MGGEIKTHRGDFARIMIRPFDTWGWKFNDAQADMLYGMIAEFNEDAMEAATKHILMESKFRPKPAEIIAACKKFSSNEAPSGEHLNELDRRDEEHAQKGADYTASFMKQDSLADEARREGWDIELEKFVKHTASSMLQIINAKLLPTGKYRGFGWSNHAVPADYIFVYKNLLITSVMKLRMTKEIDVYLALPNMLPNYWKAQAAKTVPQPETQFDRDAKELLKRVMDHFKLKPYQDAA